MQQQGQSPKRIRKHFLAASGAPKCGRQLSRPGSTTANQQSMQLTSDPLEVGCRHCLRAMGLLAPVTRSSYGFADEDSEAEREVDRLMYEQELEEEGESDEG